MSHQFSLERIHVHILEFFDELLLTPHIEIVEPRLPELGQGVIGTLETKPQLLSGHGSVWLATHTPRQALLQDLHHGRRRSLGRFADEQVNVLWHDDISDQRESVAVAHFAQNLHEKIFGANRSKQRQAPITTAGDEVEMTLPVPASQSFGHGNRTKNPALEKRQGRGTQTRYRNSLTPHSNGIIRP